MKNGWRPGILLLGANLNPFQNPQNVSYARNFLMPELFNAIQPELIFAQGVRSMEVLSPRELGGAVYSLDLSDSLLSNKKQILITHRASN